MPRSDFKRVIAESSYVFIIGVAGDSGTGKTTFTRAIREIFGEDLVSTITIDDYHRYDRRERKELGITPLVPEANRFDLLEEHLDDLKAGRTIQKPVYNHDNGKFEPPVPFKTHEDPDPRGAAPVYNPKDAEPDRLQTLCGPGPRRQTCLEDQARRGAAGILP